MKKFDYVFFGLITLMIMIAVGAFAVDSDIYDDVVTILVATVILYFIVKLGLRYLFYWLFWPISRTYRIKKGNNYSGWRFKPFYKAKPKHLTITMHSSCKVETEGIQKIFGLGDINHHDNSFRIGYKYDKDLDLFYLYTYQYSGGVLFWDFVDTVKAERRYVINIPKRITDRYTWGKFLFFYFEQDGDDEKGAPHDMAMTLTIK